MSVCSTCGKPLQFGDFPFCPHGRDGGGGNRLTAIHPSDRPVILRNPRTGEVRYPADSRLPVHPKYAAQGYVREELSTPQAIREFERSTGKLHERSHYDPGSATAERDLTAHDKPPAITGLDE